MKFGIFPTSSSDSNLFSSIVRLGATAALFTASTSFNSNSVAQAKLHSPENPASNYDKVVTYCAHNAQRKQWQNHNKLVEKHRHHYETNQNATRSVRESNDSVAKSSHASRKSTKKTRKQTRQGLLLFNESSARKHRKGNVLFDPPQPFIDDLPTRQARHRPHRQGILFCQSGTYMEILGHESRTRNGQHYQRFQFDDSDDDFDSDDDEDGNNGLVRGTSRKGSKFSIVEFLSIALGLVSIRGIASDHFLCMNSHGRLYSTPIKNFNNECVFMEEMLKNYYNLYSSCVYGSPKRPWYVALRKTGRTKLGSHTRKRQKSSHFVLIDLERSTLDRWLATEDEHFAPDFYEVSAVQSHLSNGARKR